MFFIGDVHGKIESYLKVIERLPPLSSSIQVGDMGIGFGGVHLRKIRPGWHRFIRGNHDCPEKCRAHANYLGDYGYLEEHDLFYLSGAYSIDRAWRTPGVSWWKDEELDHLALESAVKLYSEMRPAVVVTHEGPTEIVKILLLGLMSAYFAEKADCANSRTSVVLQRMLNIHRPKVWVFGHYHVDKTIQTADTKFICLGELSGFQS